jgi:hypothetical protein
MGYVGTGGVCEAQSIVRLGIIIRRGYLSSVFGKAIGLLLSWRRL